MSNELYSTNTISKAFRIKALMDNEINIYDTVIEERDGDEVRFYGGARICPEGTEVINPAFDITPKELITGIITEKGIIDPI